ncbi:hypothetical protein KAR91_20090 [Candidatus Pacearchaeota archaeon]|nr:hypothetical protein [Candidatus Pacearchaeota archaeon]
MSEVRYKECSNQTGQHSAWFPMFLREASKGSISEELSLQPGVGSILKSLLRHFSFLICAGCAKLANTLDKQGPDWSRENIEWILDEMKKNANKAGVPFSRFIARRFVLVAIRRADILTR